MMKRQRGVHASWEQNYMAARAELALARHLGASCLTHCLEHLARAEATTDDYRFDLLGNIDVKACEPHHRNLVVSRVHPDVRYVLLRATRTVSRVDNLHELEFEVMGWSPGDVTRFEPFRADTSKSFQSASDLLPLSSLMLELLKDRSRRAP
jgi:hypothetical protein